MTRTVRCWNLFRIRQIDFWAGGQTSQKSATLIIIPGKLSPLTQGSDESTAMKYHTAFMQSLLENTGVLPLKTLAAQPDMKAVYRFVVYYADGRARHSVATLFDERGLSGARLEVVYAGFNGHQPMKYTIAPASVTALIDIFARVRFDRLPDGSTPAGRPRTLWLIERAAGTFYRAVMLSPHEPVLPYSSLVNAIDAYLTEAIREMKP